VYFDVMGVPPGTFGGIQVGDIEFLSPRLPGWETQESEFGSTLWLFNIGMENGPFIDGLPFT
jgi:hypothetical protein